MDWIPFAFYNETKASDKRTMALRFRAGKTTTTTTTTGKKPPEAYNVFLIGIDSVSRNNFHRQFKETAKFLREELKAIELLG